MFKKKKGFFITYDSKKYLNCLNYTEKGYLFDALYDYMQYKTLKTKIPKSVEIVFKIFQDIIDKNSDFYIKYDQKIQNSKNRNISILTLNQLKDFEEYFYSKYPRKEDRIKAEYAWKKLYPMDKDLLIKISLGIDNCYKYDRNWKQLNKQYIKLPATWLNVRGWENEYEIDTKTYTKNYDGNIL